MRDSTGSSSCAPDGEPFALQRESVGLACLAQRGRPFDDAPIKVDMATAAGNPLPVAVRIMDTIAQAATVASRTPPTVRSPGPSRADYDVTLEETGANTSMVFVPPRFAADAHGRAGREQ